MSRTAAVVALLLAVSACGNGSERTTGEVALPVEPLATTTVAPTTTAATTTTATTAATTTTTTTAASTTTGGAVAESDAYGTVTVSGTALPPTPRSGSDAAVGSPIPGLAGHDFSGSPVVIEDDGHPKMIVFLAHWCPHCQRELPIVQSWLDETPPPDDVDVYAVATLTRPDRDNYPPAPWFAREGWSAPVIVDDRLDSAASAYGLTAVPFWIIADDEGRLVARGSGAVPPEVLTEIATSIAEGGPSA